MVNTRVYGYQNLGYQSFDILFVQENGTRQAVGLPIDVIMREVDSESCCAQDPTLRLSFSAAQELFQSMWNQGYRPKDGSSGKAEVDALQAHIKFAESVVDRVLK